MQLIQCLEDVCQRESWHVSTTAHTGSRIQQTGMLATNPDVLDLAARSQVKQHGIVVCDASLQQH